MFLYFISILSLITSFEYFVKYSAKTRFQFPNAMSPNSTSPVSRLLFSTFWLERPAPEVTPKEQQAGHDGARLKDDVVLHCNIFLSFFFLSTAWSVWVAVFADGLTTLGTKRHYNCLVQFDVIHAYFVRYVVWSGAPVLEHGPIYLKSKRNELDTKPSS